MRWEVCVTGWAIVDGVLTPLSDARVPVTDAAFTTGWSVFETARVRGGAILGWPLHRERLLGSAAEVCVPMPDLAVLEAELEQLVAAAGADGRVRITLTGSGCRALVWTPNDPGRAGRPVTAARGIARADPYVSGRAKHGSRAGWRAAVARAGVDDVLLVDEHGRFTEGTMSAIVVVIDGMLWIAPDDGRILQSTTVTRLLARAEALGVPVVRQGADARGAWAGLYIASATRRLAPVVELDGVAQPGWEPVGRMLFHDQDW